MAVPKASIVMATTSNLSALNGPSIHFINLANELSRLGHPISILMPQLEAPLAISFDAEVQQIGKGNARRVGLPATLSAVGMMRAISRVKADVLYLRASPATFLLAIAAKRQPKLGLVVEYNGWLAEDASVLGYPAWACRLTRSLQLCEARQADSIRVVTSGLKSILTSYGIPAERIATIGNGTSTSVFRPMEKAACRASLGLEGEGPVLGFVGNLWPGVDFASLFQALVLLRASGRTARLLVVGDGVERQRLEGEAARLLPAGVVRFLGSQKPEAAAVAIGASDLGLAPFLRIRNERVGLSPLKLRDYAAAGRPVVATELGGINELASEPWLFMAEPENPHALARAIERCLDSDLPALDRQARAYAEANFSWATVAKSVSSLVSCVAAPRLAAPERH
jgi:glycosyltransferase involved in cell wall biosynthesis